MPQRRVGPTIGCPGVARLVSGVQTRVLFAWVYWLDHDAKGTRGSLCFSVLKCVVSVLFQLSLAVLYLWLRLSFFVAHTGVVEWFSLIKSSLCRAMYIINLGS